MIKCFLNLKNSLLVCLILLSSYSFAKPLGHVNSIHGNVFALKNGKAIPISTGDVLEDFVEIVTEEGAQITFSDYYDHKFHLAGSGHVRLLKRLVDLKRGYLWVQTHADNLESMLQTANSRVTYEGGEAILSFDPNKGKTQLLVLTGNFKFANLWHGNMQIAVDQGHFSFIHKDFNNGSPRQLTTIGKKSFESILSLYRNVKPLSAGSQEWLAQIKKENLKKRKKKGSKLTRSVASEKKDTSELKLGKFVYLKKKKRYHSKKFKLNKFYSEKLKIINKRKGAYLKKRRLRKKNIFVPIIVFGQSSNKVRAPASIRPKKLKNTRINPQVVIQRKSSFESTLLNEFAKQMRHSNEVNQLIKDLNNYDQDYKHDY